MKNHLITYLLPILLFGCSTAQLNQSAAVIVPIAEAAADQYAVAHGLSPTSAENLIGTANQLFGMSSVAYQGQPPSTGATDASVAAAALSKTPSGTSTQQAAVLLAVAQALQNQATGVKVNGWVGR